MHNSSSLIRVSNAGFKQNDRWLVRGVNVDIQKGKIVTLIGPNGSGKSTTVKMALGLLDASEGKIERNSNLQIGYVPQKLNIDWMLPLTVNRFMRLTGDIPQAKVDAAMERTGVSKLHHAKVNELSGGEFQRMLLARAIARDPDLLVLDEPVQGVDFNGEIELYDLIKDVRDELNCGVLLISHDIHFVMAATDHVVCLNGHVCCQGTPTSVAASSEYKELFGSRASSTLAVYEHEHDHKHLPDGRVQHADGSITEHCHPDDGHHHDHA